MFWLSGRHQHMIKLETERGESKGASNPPPLLSFLFSFHLFLLVPRAKEAEAWIQVIRRVIYGPRGGGMFGTAIVDQVVMEGRGPTFPPILIEKCVQSLRLNGTSPSLSLSVYVCLSVCLSVSFSLCLAPSLSEKLRVVEFLGEQGYKRLAFSGSQAARCA